MNIRELCLFFLGLVWTTQAIAQQGCPYPSSVKYIEDAFQAGSAHSLWKSPKMKSQDFVDRFVGAIFVPGDGQERKNGYLEKCIYLTNRGRPVTLRYGMEEEVLNMSLVDTTYWQPAIDLFGLNIYVCDDRQPDNCSFTVDESLR
ncbi:DUF3757 domain-containing protein [Pseudomonas fluorescens]|uniref:DUF3757 domain-containing protein n=1 Tax=Pseudomonas fluorescens TaxID=294 RepID=UPI001BE80417|nr:DUF3757 domain-containing protein [Pseudomonas fluorescens]MBT2374378.1 DUF3757 domain-containing protein [Pseudomonas fluorescens]